MKSLFPILSVTALLATSAATAQADMITASLTVDNGYQVFVSTDDAVAGTLIGSDNEWNTTETYSFNLTPNVINYIHVRGEDWGVIAGFLGQFTIVGSDFKFANATSQLLTNPTDWTVNYTGFGAAPVAPIVHGVNGMGPWNNRAGISSQAQWLGFPVGTNANHTVAYFSAAVLPVNVIPEPASLALLALGGTMMFTRRTHKA